MLDIARNDGNRFVARLAKRIGAAQQIARERVFAATVSGGIQLNCISLTMQLGNNKRIAQQRAGLQTGFI